MPMTPTQAMAPPQLEPCRNMAGGAAALRRHAWVIPWIVAVLLLDGWVVTWGDGRLFDRESFCGFYDAQARALLHGRLDVPRDAIRFEAFVRDSKYYGYFGVAPALLRLPLVALFPTMDGRWSRLFMWIACLGNMLVAYRLLLRALAIDAVRSAPHRIAAAAFIVMAGAGSTTLFLASRSYVYHEAIMWGALWTLACLDALIAYCGGPTPGRLILAGACAFMAFNTRPTAGAGALLALGAVAALLARRAVGHGRWRSAFSALFSGRTCAARTALRSSDLTTALDVQPIATEARAPILPPVDRPGLHLQIALAAMALTLGMYFAVNFGRFRTFDGVPVRYYQVYARYPELAAATGGKQLHLENLATGLANYFSFAGVELRSTFPWVFMAPRPCIIGHPAIERLEPFCGIPIAMPALFLLAVVGMRPLFRPCCATGRRPQDLPSELALRGVGRATGGREGQAVRRRDQRAGTAGDRGTGPAATIQLRFALAAACALAGGILVAMSVGITHRYLHDFFPFLIVAASVGWARLLQSPRPRRALLAMLFLTLLSAGVNFAFAMQFQREIVWGVPEAKQTEYLRVRMAVDRLLGAQATNPAGGASLSSPAFGR